MKLLQLTLSAFGPFADKQHIDFTKLGDSPLFLIDGPTGAGKSSILHAICYALYGETTDEARKEQGIRSDHANDDLLTQVSLTFSIKDKRYRISRVPTQMRAGKRGDKLVKHNATAELIELLHDDSERLLVAKKKGEADDYIKQILGLTADQFRQVMVLPQGKFRELLLANSNERQAILSTLFATDIYQKIEQHIKQRALDIEGRYKQLRTRIEETLEEVAADNLQQLTQRHSEQQTLVSQLAEDKVKADNNRQLRLAKLTDGKSLAEHFRKLATTKSMHRQLLCQQPQINQVKQRIQLALHAQKIKPLYETSEQIQADLTQANAQQHALTEQQSQLSKQLEERQRLFEHALQQMPQREQHQQAIIDLKNLLPMQQNFTRLQAEMHDAQSQLNAHKQLLASTQQDYKTLSQRSENGRELIDATIKELNQGTGLQEQQQRLQQQATLVRQQQDVQKALVDAQTRYQQADNAWQQQQQITNQAEHQYHQQASLYHSSQAAILATQLEIGQPCPVCGATEHPSPCQMNTEQTVDQQQLKVVEQRWHQQKQRLADADKLKDQYQLTVLQQQQALQQLTAQLEEVQVIEPSLLEQQLTTVNQQLKTLAEKATKIEKWQQSQQSMQAQLMPLQQQIDELNRTLPDVTANFTAKQQTFLQVSESLPDIYRVSGTIDAKIEELQSQIKHVEQAHQQAQQALLDAQQKLAKNQTQQENQQAMITQLSQRLSNAQQQLQQALESYDFADIAEFHNAYISDDELTQLQIQVQQFERQLDNIVAQIATLDELLTNKIQPDLSVLNTELSVAEQQLTAAEKALSSAQQQLNRLSDAQQKITKIEQQQADNKQQYEIIGTLAAAASGKGNVKVSLERFVLADLLDSVLAIASKRLQQMSKGQYQLVRQNESEQKRNVAAGLDLAVNDSYSGKQRPVATLSGGESFMASLSLALALSDVVQQRSGGIVLDTLFIDEGFGSLDQESLQLAVETLVDLQATGRAIGIISHVSELKEQMGQRIDVKNGRSGSAISLVTQ
ncbi:AAA family ATPase [Thalassotalea maritima]|uniref:AAA family ATPase n=1 Tax=Thalassotalea maritima TaxID=3242416 RepID=UPI0035293B65